MTLPRNVAEFPARMTGIPMIDKSQILDMIRSFGDKGKVDEADRELPDQVDTDRDGGLLSKFGLDVDDIVAKLTGGGGLGKLLG